MNGCLRQTLLIIRIKSSDPQSLKIRSLKGFYVEGLEENVTI